MGKVAILVLGVLIGSTWATSRQAVTAAMCADSARSSQSAEPGDHHDYLEKLRSVGGELWHRVARPMLASAATHALNGLVDLLRNIADNASSNGRSHASLDRRDVPAHPPARE